MFFTILVPFRGRGTITSIVLTPAAPTVLSNGLGYFLAGKAYVFTIQVVDPDATGWGDITDVRITITNSTNIVVRNTNPLAGSGPFGVTVDSGSVSASGSVTAGTFNNFTVQFTITFQWNTPESLWAAARNITASATTSQPAPNTLTDTKLVAYGVVSSISILNFAQDGDAADGRVNPWHTAFNVTGTVVYNIPGATAADAIDLIADAGAGEYAAPGATLFRGAVATPHVDATPAALIINVAAEWFNALGWATAAGNHTWFIQVAMTTPGGPETSVNSLAINCDRIQVTNIEFINGGGTTVIPYYRSVNFPGTQIRVTAQMEWAGTPMVGATTIRISDNLGVPNTYDVMINNGANQGIATMDVAPNNYPAVPGDIPDLTTTMLQYSAIRVFGGAYDGDSIAAEGQDDFASITQAALGTYYCMWDANDPPGQNAAPFTPFNPGGIGQTPYSLTLAWTALTAAGPPDWDGDFFTYRVYYRLNVGPGPWIIVDRNTAGYANLGLIATNSVTLTSLQPVTNYDYYITAVDLFGQEVAAANATYDGAPIGGFDTIATLASLTEVSLTDGIVSYNEAQFEANPDDPVLGNRSFRKTALRATVRIVTLTGVSINSASLIVAQNAPVPDLILGATIDPGLTLGVDYYRIPLSKYAPNTWVGYIPATSAVGSLMDLGNQVRFLLEVDVGGVTSYIDTNSDTEVPPGDPNNAEYTFIISQQPNFTPWPTRILNNVITGSNPVAYPSFYLSEDAYVTIRVYDIKGRAVVTLLEKSFRRGGQNIKEQGWDGRNKFNRKVGVGLYYVHIKAESVSSGKTILNSFKKVVVAR